MGLDRLLHELDVQALVLHLVEQLDGLLGAPGLVGIDVDANVVAYLFADRHETGHIQRGIGAHLDLQGVIPALMSGGLRISCFDACALQEDK